MSTPIPPPLNYCTVVSETKRIFISHSTHFNALSLLFILPLSISITALNFLLQYSPDHPQKSAALAGLALSSFLFAALADGSVTHSVIRIFRGQPVDLIPAVKSGFASFFPISVTSLFIHLVLSFIALIFLCSFQFVVRVLEIVPDSPCFVALAVIYAAGFFSIVAYVRVSWALASVVVVAESGFGVSALKRSGYLVEGKRAAILCILVPYGVAVGFAASTGAMTAAKLDGGDWSRLVLFVGTVVLILFMLIRLLLSLYVATAVIYVYRKADIGDQGISDESLCLPSGDDKVKVPLLASVSDVV